MSTLLQLDAFLTRFIYHLPHNIFLDTFFQFVSAIGSYGLIWVFIVLYIIVVEERRDHRQFTIPFLLTILISIALSIYLKNIFMRSRPTMLLSDFSFPSLHATVAFAAATFLSLFDKNKRVAFYFVAFLIVFSRVYLGFHYVGDVICGAVLGIIISLVINYETKRTTVKKS